MQDAHERELAGLRQQHETTVQQAAAAAAVLQEQLEQEGDKGQRQAAELRAVLGAKAGEVEALRVDVGVKEDEVKRLSDMLTSDIALTVRPIVSKREGGGERGRVCVWVRVCVCVSLCAFACARTLTQAHTHTGTSAERHEGVARCAAGCPARGDWDPQAPGPALLSTGKDDRRTQPSARPRRPSNRPCVPARQPRSLQHPAGYTGAKDGIRDGARGAGEPGGRVGGCCGRCCDRWQRRPRSASRAACSLPGVQERPPGWQWSDWQGQRQQGRSGGGGGR